MASIVVLRTKPERLRTDQAAVLRQALLPFEEAMPDAVRALISHIDRQTASRNRWTFVMINPAQNDAVVNFLADYSTRPVVGMKLWSLCFNYLRNDTCEIMLTREEFAEKLQQRVQEVSTIMTELEDFGAIIRRVEKVAGLRGRGIVRYYMNPMVATHLSGAERDKAQADAPPLLRLMEDPPKQQTER
jgi:hypothetical protein